MQTNEIDEPTKRAIKWLIDWTGEWREQHLLRTKYMEKTGELTEGVHETEKEYDRILREFAAKI